MHFMLVLKLGGKSIGRAIMALLNSHSPGKLGEFIGKTYLCPFGRGGPSGQGCRGGWGCPAGLWGCRGGRGFCGGLGLLWSCNDFLVDWFRLCCCI